MFDEITSFDFHTINFEMKVGKIKHIEELSGTKLEEKC
jgi:hypothetical protein